MAKITDEQMQEALNPGMSKTVLIIGNDENTKAIKIKIMSARKEPIFIRDMKNTVALVMSGVDAAELSTQKLINLLEEIPVEKLADIAVHVTTNSGEAVDADWLLDNCSITQLIELIKLQIDKQGYLDFLLHAMAKLNLGKAVLPSSNTL